MHLPALLLLLSAAAPAHSHAHAEPATPFVFGNAGQIAISSEFQAAVGYVNIGGSGQFQLALLPAADYFIAPHFSVGAQLGFELLTGSGSTNTVFWGSPRVGYAIPLGTKVSVWPRLGVFLAHASASVSSGGSSSATGFGVQFSIPVLFHLSRHFFLGAGPYLSAQLTGDVKQTTANVSFTVGGWL
jgi:hypothetical protein